ncbi:MAG TPA: hypothetical protein VK698_34885 [Kofleriaceae bacterium]|nr:hypothetical protein [Kofleriaceae bacterium]
MAGRWARLAAAFFCIGLVASRVSLVLHELVGHGAVAMALGGRVAAYHLFLFGGGWVSYRWGPEHGTAATIAVSMGGIALEVVAAAAALIAARWLGQRAPIARLALVGFATADLLHAGFYLAAGAHHGFGDGRVLRDQLGAARAVLVWPVACAVVVAGFFLARRLAGLAGDWVGAPTRGGRTAALVSAALVAGLLHGGLAVAERVAARDATYSRIMKPERDRQVEGEMERLAREARGQGAPLDERQLAALRAELERRAREFPLAPVLIGALVLACAAGVWRGGSRADGEPRAPSWRALVPLGAAAGAAMALVAVLRLFE